MAAIQIQAQVIAQKLIKEQGGRKLVVAQVKYLQNQVTTFITTALVTMLDLAKNCSYSTFVTPPIATSGSLVVTIVALPMAKSCKVLHQILSQKLSLFVSEFFHLQL